MRQIQIVLPDEEVEKVLNIAKKSDLKAAHVRSAGEIDLVVITVPDEHVNDYINELKAERIDKIGTISILPIHASLCDVEFEKAAIAPKEEIVESARRACYPTKGYVFMIVVSAFVATLGLLMNSVAVVIGAMVIAPLLGPSIAASVGTVMGDTSLFRKGILSTTIGLMIVIITSAATAFLVNTFQLLPPLLEISPENLPSEMAERTTLNVLIVGLALASGAAGAYSFAEKKGEILVGVMIAVALVPPASIVGIGIGIEALRNIDFILSSGLLLAVNVICINIAATLVFWKLGIKPDSFMKMLFSKKEIKKKLGITLVILIILGGVLSWTTWTTYQNYRLEKRIEKESLDFITGGNFTSIIDKNVDEIRLGRSIFGIEYDDPVYIRITIYSDNITSCKNINLAKDVHDHLEIEFKDEIDKGFEVEIIFLEKQKAT